MQSMMKRPRSRADGQRDDETVVDASPAGAVSVKMRGDLEASNSPSREISSKTATSKLSRPDLAASTRSRKVQNAER